MSSQSSRDNQIGRPSRPGIHYSGETQPATLLTNKPRKKCPVESCNCAIGPSQEYCHKHRNKCVDCGSRICLVSIRCRSCSVKESSRLRMLSSFVCKQNSSWKTGSREQELAHVIECYERALATGFHTSLCADALPKLRAELAMTAP